MLQIPAGPLPLRDLFFKDFRYEDGLYRWQIAYVLWKKFAGSR